MAGEHILVDGYSILYHWPELQPFHNRSLAAGREALIQILTQFHDARGGRLTVVFDGRSLPPGGTSIRTSIEVVYSKEGQTADSIIEKMVAQSPDPKAFLVATEDYAEQNTIESFGGQSISAQGFHAMVEAELDELEHVLQKLTFKNHPFTRGR